MGFYSLIFLRPSGFPSGFMLTKRPSGNRDARERMHRLNVVLSTTQPHTFIKCQCWLPLPYNMASWMGRSSDVIALFHEFKQVSTHTMNEYPRVPDEFHSLQLVYRISMLRNHFGTSWTTWIKTLGLRHPSALTEA